MKNLHVWEKDWIIHGHLILSRKNFSTSPIWRVHFIGGKSAVSHPRPAKPLSHQQRFIQRLPKPLLVPS